MAVGAFVDLDRHRQRFARRAAERRRGVVRGRGNGFQCDFRRFGVDNEGSLFALAVRVPERAFLFCDGRVGPAFQSRRGAHRAPFARFDRPFSGRHRRAFRFRAAVDLHGHGQRFARRAAERRFRVVRRRRHRGQRHFGRFGVDHEGARFAFAEPVPERAVLFRHRRVGPAFENRRGAHRPPIARFDRPFRQGHRRAFHFRARVDLYRHRQRFARRTAERGAGVVRGRRHRGQGHHRWFGVDHERLRFAFAGGVAERAGLFRHGRVGPAFECGRGARGAPFAEQHQAFRRSPPASLPLSGLCRPSPSRAAVRSPCR